MEVFLKLLLLFALFSCGSSKDVEYCYSLKKKSKDSKIASYIETWITQNFVEGEITRDDMALGGFMAPGLYYVKNEIDWSVLGFRSDFAQARLLGLNSGSFQNEYLKGIKAIFFTERSGYGIMVKLPTSSSFGLLEDYNESFDLITDNVGVLCHDIDR